MATSAYFHFRVWFHANGDSANVEVFYGGLEPELKPDKRSVTEWIKDSFSGCDFCKLFHLEESKAYQIVGLAKLEATDEDERIRIVFSVKQELKDGQLL